MTKTEVIKIARKELRFKHMGGIVYQNDKGYIFAIDKLIGTPMGSGPVDYELESFTKKELYALFNEQYKEEEKPISELLTELENKIKK